MQITFTYKIWILKKKFISVKQQNVSHKRIAFLENFSNSTLVFNIV